MLSELLKAFGCTVMTVADGATALSVATDFAPTVAVVDLALPDIEGFEVGRRLRNLSGLGGIALVAITGHTVENYAEKSAAAGFQAHLVKPFPPDAFRRTVEKLAAWRLSVN